MRHLRPGTTRSGSRTLVFLLSAVAIVLLLVAAFVMNSQTQPSQLPSDSASPVVAGGGNPMHATVDKRTLPPTATTESPDEVVALTPTPLVAKPISVATPEPEPLTTVMPSSPPTETVESTGSPVASVPVTIPPVVATAPPTSTLATSSAPVVETPTNQGEEDEQIKRVQAAQAEVKDLRTEVERLKRKLVEGEEQWAVERRQRLLDINNGTNEPSVDLSTLSHWEETQYLNRPTVRTMDEAKCHKTERTLYLGHSHILLLKQAHCNLAMIALGPKRQLGADIVGPCKPFVYGLMSPYLRSAQLVKNFQTHQGFKKGGFGSIFMSTWAWDLLWDNSHPTQVYHRLMNAMVLALGVQRAHEPLERPARRKPVKIVITMPHYLRRPSQKRRAPCQTEDRVMIYSMALEAAAYSLKLKIEKEHKAKIEALLEGAKAKNETFTGPFPLPAAEILLVDYYNWSKQLNNGHITRTKLIDNPWGTFTDRQFQPNSTWHDGGDNDYSPDGTHLRDARMRDLALALFERGLICDPNTPRLVGPRALNPENAPSLIRPPTDTRHYVDLVNRGDFRDNSGPGPPQVHLGDRNLTAEEAEKNELQRLNWPSRPTCEGTLKGSDSRFFWGNMLSWLDEDHFVKVRAGMGEMLERNRYPRSNILRQQVLRVLAQNTSGMSFLQTRFEVLECLNNVGLDENATTWSSGAVEDLPGNVDYIMWTRTKKLGALRPEGDSSGDGNETLTERQKEKAYKALLLANTRNLAASPIPSCVCANQTHLLDRVHWAIVENARDDGGSVAESAMRGAIATYCESVLPE